MKEVERAWELRAQEGAQEGAQKGAKEDTIHFGHAHAPLRAFLDKLIDMSF